MISIGIETEMSQIATKLSPFVMFLKVVLGIFKIALLVSLVTVWCSLSVLLYTISNLSLTQFIFLIVQVNGFEVHDPEEAILLFLEQDQDITLTVARPLKVSIK